MNDKPEVEAAARHVPAEWHPEIELKLSASPGVLAALVNVPPLVFASGSNKPSRQLESTYFDTRDRALRKAGITLRVRHVGGTYTQTIKIKDPVHGAHARLERDDPVDGPRPRPALLHDAFGQDLSWIGDDDLKPLFTSRIERRAMMLTTGSAEQASQIEIAFDRGVVTAGRKSEPVCEMELELEDGSVADLYDLALTLHRLQTLVIEVRSKSQRGFTLAEGMAPSWHKSTPLDLTPKTTLDQAIGQVMSQCFDHWMSNQAAAFDGSDREGVHQMRISLRRLRAAFDFFEPWLPEGQTAWFRGEVKWLGKQLGTARDLDVLGADTLAPVMQARPCDKALIRLDGLVTRRGAAAYARLARALASPRYTGLVLTLGQWIAARGCKHRDREAMAHSLTQAVRVALDSAHGQVQESGRDFESLTMAQRHGLRLDVKRLRYAMQFVGSAYGGSAAYLKALSDLQDALGAANDAVQAEAQLDTCIRYSATG
ncbi:MAG: CHAD domain-containing protein, partial [Alphaproteobacteria bacterium]|nr:CHAD domain-containing protein [Alphaproteobacteria bacterium]